MKLHYDGQDWNNKEWIQDLASKYAVAHQRKHQHTSQKRAMRAFDIVIIDSYEANSPIYTTLAQNARALICLDDTQRIIYPPHSIILNPLPESYEIFSQKCFATYGYTLWCGEQYVILPSSSLTPCERVDSGKQTASTQSPLESSHPKSNSPLDSGATTMLDSPYQSQKPTESISAQSPESKALLAGGICQVFVSFGGVDRANYTQGFVDFLAQYMENDSPKLAQSNTQKSSTESWDSGRSDSALGWHFHIVLGGGYSHELYTNALPAGSFNLYRNLNPAQFLDLARSCDCAISAGGGSMLELLALQVPSIILESADNQHAQIMYWAARGAIIHAKSLESTLTLLHALLAPARLSAMRTLLGSLSLGTALPLALDKLAQSLQNSTNPSQK